MRGEISWRVDARNSLEAVGAGAKDAAIGSVVTP
jgi:hypothetical protein